MTDTGGAWDQSGSPCPVSPGAAVITGQGHLGGELTSVSVGDVVRPTGASPTQIQARACNDGSAEPSAWQLIFTDSTAGLQAAGAVGPHASAINSTAFNSLQVTGM